MQLVGAMKGLTEHWWWSPADNSAELSKFHRSEPKQKMKASPFLLKHAAAIITCSTYCCNQHDCGS